MSAESNHAGITGACDDIEQACRELERPTPETMERSAEALRSAIEGLRKSLATRCPVELAQAQRLQRAVKTAKALLEQANRYQAFWHGILVGMSGTYTPNGVTGPLWLRWRCWQEG